MTEKKRVLVVGLEPTLIDFSAPEYADYLDMDAARVSAGLKAAEDSLKQLGFDVQMCLTDFGDTAEEVVKACLDRERFDCILIGAGIRAIPGNFLLFEKLINVVHTNAPRARICFNTIPTDTADAVLRWL